MTNSKLVHAITARYLGATYSKPSRITLSSLRFPNNRVTFSYDSSFGDMDKQAQHWLESHGYTVLFMAENNGNGYLYGVAEFEELSG